MAIKSESIDQHVGGLRLAADGAKAVLFDIGNVLLHFSADKMYEQIQAVTGLMRVEARAILTHDRLRIRYELGELTTDDLVEHFRRKAKLAFYKDDFVMAFSDVFTENTEILPILAKLKRTGRKLVVVSNTNEAHMRFALPRYKCFDYFDEFIFSYEVGALKPQLEFYRAATVAAGCNPGDAIFVDDLIENCQGASVFGFKPIIFTETKTFVAAAEPMGLRLNWR